MTRILSIFMLTILLIAIIPCGIAEESRGFSGLSDDVLTQLYEAVSEEMVDRGLLEEGEQPTPAIDSSNDSPLISQFDLERSVEIYPGTYAIGEDLKAGSYMLELYAEEKTSVSAYLAIYSDAQHMYDEDPLDYTMLSLLYSTDPTQYRFSVTDGMYIELSVIIGDGYKLKLYY